MNISREIKTAILVIGSILLFLLGFSYLKGKNLFSTDHKFYTEFSYNALSVSAPVTIRGNKVGKVEEITYDFETGKTKVCFSVDKNFMFSKNSTIRLYEMGIMGGNAITIIPASDIEYAQDGDFIKSEVEEGLVKSLTSKFSGLSTDLDATLKKADVFLTNLNDIIEDESEKGLKSAIAQLNATIKTFNTTATSLNTIVNNDASKLNVMLTEFSETATAFKRISDTLENANIGNTVANLNKTLSSLNTVLVAVDSKEGSIGKLLHDDKLYNNLEAASKELSELLRDIKLHPKRYTRVFSKKEIPFKGE